MSSKEDIRLQLVEWFEEMITRFDWISFRYEFSSKLGCWLVAYYPSDKVDESADFCMESMAFEDKMNLLHGTNAPLFGNEEECFQLSDKAVVFQHSAVYPTSEITIESFPEYSFCPDNLTENFTFDNCHLELAA